TLIRLLVTVAVLVAYFLYRDWVVDRLHRLWLDFTGMEVKPATVAGWLVAALMAGLVWAWRTLVAKDKRFHAPLLVSSVLLLGDAGFGILESHYSSFLSAVSGGLLTRYSPTFVVILTTIAAELLLGRFYYGKWPHPASAYVSGISAGI